MRLRSLAEKKWKALRPAAPKPASLPDDPTNPKARIALNLLPLDQPWGGGNQWATQLVCHLREQGFSVRFTLDGRLDCVLLASLISPRKSPATTFGIDDIRAHKRAHPDTVVLHRVNENDQRRGTRFVDPLIEEANELADYTVFLSAWLRDYHAARWFDVKKPHRVILNGASPDVFHPRDGSRWSPGTPLRIVTHHWSDHPLKGFEEYQRLDAMIAGGAVGEVDLVVIGRWPESIRWRRAEYHRPAFGASLAGLLRSCHVYLTASRWEPGGMHFIEGLQCGLPLLYHEDGGGIVELGERFGIAYRADLKSAIDLMRSRYSDLREAVLSRGPSGRRMCQEYEEALGICLGSRAKTS